MKAEWTNKDSLTPGETTEAILVINLMPKSCDECKFETEALNCGKPMCVATPHRRERIEDDSTKPSWCPLKPLPDCPDCPENISNDVAYILGWNDCIVEISKERKEAKSLIKNEEESVSNRGER